VVVWASGLHIEEPGAEPDLPPGVERGPRAGRTKLEDLYFHVRAGELLALRIAPEEGRLLLHTLAGLCRPRVGALHVNGPAILISALGDGMEQQLTVAENIQLLGAFLGCHVPALADRLDELAALAGASDWLGSALGDAPPALAARLALMLALECAHPRLLLVDRLPPLQDEEFAAWAALQATSRAAGGLAIVQLIEEPAQALRAPDRALWVHERKVRACGHPASVLDAAWRSEFDPEAQRRYRAPARAAVRL
jgi:ABC-type polysaccharide/polyol phosphate transport system ATPase subunit